MLALTLVTLGAAALAVHPVASVQPAGRDTQSFVFQAGRPFHLAADDAAGGVVVIGDSAIIEGAVNDPLVVIDGTAIVRGTVRHDVVVIGGRLELEPGARVGHDVVLVRSTMRRDPDALIAGDVIERTATLAITQRMLFIVWLSMTVALLGAGLAFATFGRPPLEGAAGLLRHDTARAVLGALVLWAGLPFAAVLVMMTGVGVPLGLGILVFLLPALWFLGYLVAGATAGRLMAGWLGAASMGTARAVAAGVLTLQIVQFVPGLGAAITVVAGLLGSGAIAVRLWARRTGAGTAAAPNREPELAAAG